MYGQNQMSGCGGCITEGQYSAATCSTVAQYSFHLHSMPGPGFTDSTEIVLGILGHVHTRRDAR